MLSSTPISPRRQLEGGFRLSPVGSGKTSGADSGAEAPGIGRESILERDDSSSQDGELAHMDLENMVEPDCYMQLQPLASPLGETIYAMATAGIVHDYVRLSTGTEYKCRRVSRIMVLLGSVLFTVYFQKYLLGVVNDKFVAPAVEDIQSTYNDYELHMYGADRVSVSNRHVRGVPLFLNSTAFGSFPREQKDKLCNISMANPLFLTFVLALWTISCLQEVKDMLKFSLRILCRTPTATAACELLEHDQDEGTVQVVGLTKTLKGLLFFLMVVPRCMIAGSLLLLGCRWLTATIDMQDLFLNGLALEFIITLKDTFYVILSTHRNKIMTENTHFVEMLPPEELGDWKEFGFISIVFLVFVFGWVLTYIFWLQEVLPHYNWDVREFCPGAGLDAHISLNPLDR